MIDVKVIDLTSESSEKDEIQKAIALSLQDQQHGMLGGQVTAEEQDISLYFYNRHFMLFFMMDNRLPLSVYVV